MSVIYSILFYSFFFLLTINLCKLQAYIYIYIICVTKERETRRRRSWKCDHTKYKQYPFLETEREREKGKSRAICGLKETETEVTLDCQRSFRDHQAFIGSNFARNSCRFILFRYCQLIKCPPYPSHTHVKYINTRSHTSYIYTHSYIYIFKTWGA